VVQIPGSGNQLGHFSWAEDHRQIEALFRIRQILFHVSPLQQLDVKEAECADVQNNGINGKLALSEQVSVITPDVVRAQFFERHADALTEVLDCFQIRADRRGSVVTANELLAHSLHECCHRDLLSLRQSYLSNNRYRSGRPSRQRLRSSRLHDLDSPADLCCPE
jgi:hypothetical protein